MLASKNCLIATLTKADQISLLKGSQKIELRAGADLTNVNQINAKIYFPISGTIALFIGKNGVADTSQGLAIGLIGAEGAAGLQLALGFGHLPFQLLVQSPGQAYAVDASVAQKLVQNQAQVLLKFSQYLWTLYEQISNFASQAHSKDIKIRLARWLLLSAQRCAPDQLRLTHLHMAKMLGVRRSSISIAAREIKLKRYIYYSRGQISLTNVPALEALSQN